MDVLLSSLLILTGSTSLAAPPGPEQDTESGGQPLRVQNPEQPAHGIVDIKLRELWQVGGDEDEIIFGTIEQLILDDSGNIYVLDGQLCRIPVFSPQGSHLRTIGRDGEGPGEFNGPQDLFHVPGGNLGIAQVFPGKIVQLEPGGDPAGLFPLPEWGSLKVFRGMGNKTQLIVAGSIRHSDGRAPGESVERTFLKAFDPEGNELHHYYHEDHYSRYGGMRFQEPEFTGFEWRWALAADGRVAAAPDFERYEIPVWSADGSLELVIERPEFLPVQRTGTEKARLQRFYESITQWSPGSSFETEEVHPTVTSIGFREDGTLWVLSSQGTWRNPDGVLAMFDVYDRSGQFVRQMRLLAPGVPGEDRVFFARDRIYVITQFFNTIASSDPVESHAEPSRLIAYTMEEIR